MPVWEIPGKVGEFDDDWRVATLVVDILHVIPLWLLMTGWCNVVSESASFQAKPPAAAGGGGDAGGNYQTMPQHHAEMQSAVTQQAMSQQQAANYQAVPQHQTVNYQAVPQHQTVNYQAMPQHQAVNYQAMPQQQAVNYQAMPQHYTDSQAVQSTACPSSSGVPHPAEVYKPTHGESTQTNTAPEVSSICTGESVAAGSTSSVPAADGVLASSNEPTTATAAVASPAAMEEALLLWMYEECCPGVQLTGPSDVPDTVTFILMYMDPHDSRFFWAALIYGTKVRSNTCKFL